ncbi:inner nuclear membrane protein Man1 [Trichuris trichiura]|uniref:Inner nuclear membrane protein Man1 n=1 Tax=Trichuris trichiura TaxID=36087 RepID=A0A077Z4K6_TRITR|nr:inner nuclear membrane protein Man1 [Trichuris trichiura]
MDSEPMPDSEIRAELRRLQIPHGPITRSTRRTYILAIEKAKRQQNSASSYGADSLKDYADDREEWVTTSSQSIRPSRQSTRRKSGSSLSYKASENQADLISLTPGLANMPSLDTKHSSGRSTPSSQRRSSSTGRSSRSYVRDIPIVQTNESVRSTEPIPSKDQSFSSPTRKGGTVRLNDWQDGIEVLESPLGSTRHRTKFADYESPIRKDKRSSLDNRKVYREERRPLLHEWDGYKEDMEPVLDKVYYSPIKDSTNWLADSVNGVQSSAMYAWDIVKRKIADVFYLNNAKPYHYNQRSRWSSYGRDETYGKWQLTDRSSQPILLFILGILLSLAVMYVLVTQRKFVSLFGTVIYGAFYDTVMVLYKRMLLPLFFIFCVFMVVASAYFYKKFTARRAHEEHQQIYELAEKITRYLKTHYRKCVEHGIQDKFLPVPHVRDHLIPISQRKAMAPIWEKAVQFICENESRIRTETHRVSGEEFLVWQWIDLVGSHEDEQEGVRMRTRQGGDVSQLHDGFDCLKIRGLFDDELNTSEKWKEIVQRTLLTELGSDVRVLHIDVDPNSSHGVVYLRMGSIEEAQEAYEVLQRSLFNGASLDRPISVKFIRTEVYFNRFPEAKYCNVPLKLNYRTTATRGFGYL